MRSSAGALGWAAPRTWLPPLPASLLTARPSLDALLFGGALLVFLLTRLIGLERFPIYFFTDEAVQTVNAADLVREGFRDATGRLFPTYFPNGPYLNLGVSVYVQVIPYELFGESIFVTRATSALICLTGSAAAGLILRDVLKLRLWWAGVLVLTVTPAWFLHSRTAFEAAEATAFYAWFLYFYLRARSHHPRNLFAALVFFALAFYTYRPLQLVMLLTGLLFALSDVRHHLRHVRYTLGGAALLVLLALPQVEFQLGHPGELYSHLRLQDSYWVDADFTLGERLQRYAREYTYGLSPAYWLSDTSGRDPVRHLMKGYGHLLLPLYPLFLLGLAVSFTRLRSSVYRALVIAALTAPAGGALVATAVTRDLVFVVPVAVFSTVGLDAVATRLRGILPYRYVAPAVFVVLAGGGVWMLRDALAKGPTWYQDYGLYGMQYGAREVAAETKALLSRSPESNVVIASRWTNGGNVVMRFFFPEDRRVRVTDIEGYIEKKLTIRPGTVFVLTAGQYEAVALDPRFAGLTLLKTLPYPNGAPAFHFVSLRYSDDAGAIFAAEAEARRQPVVEDAVVDGAAVSVLHSRFDMGRVADMFDGDSFTLARTLEANPAVVQLSFSQPRLLSGISVGTGSMRLAVTATVTPAGGGEHLTFRHLGGGRQRDPEVTLDFGRPIDASVLRIEVGDPDGGDGHIHIRDISLH